MSKKPLEIHIDMDRNCDNCGKGGATPSGYCMACVAKQIKAGKFDNIIKEKNMAKKDSMQKEVDKTEQNEEVGTFPKIASHCRIKQCMLKKGGKDIRFDNFAVSSGQTELLDTLIEAEEEVQVTISPIQGRLPGC